MVSRLFCVFLIDTRVYFLFKDSFRISFFTAFILSFNATVFNKVTIYNNNTNSFCREEENSMICKIVQSFAQSIRKSIKSFSLNVINRMKIYSKSNSEKLPQKKKTNAIKINKKKCKEMLKTSLHSY